MAIEQQGKYAGCERNTRIDYEKMQLAASQGLDTSHANKAIQPLNTSNLSVSIVNDVARTLARTSALFDALTGSGSTQAPRSQLQCEPATAPLPSALNDRLQLTLEMLSSLNSNLSNISMILGLEV